MSHKPNPGKAPDIFYDRERCPIRHVIAPISGKWPLLILSHLSFGSHRFSELLAAIPDISQRMLTQTLRGLERDGFVSRTVTAAVPPRVDYELTPLGENFLKPLQLLYQWGDIKREQIESARSTYDAAKDMLDLVVEKPE